MAELLTLHVGMKSKIYSHEEVMARIECGHAFLSTERGQSSTILFPSLSLLLCFLQIFLSLVSRRLEAYDEGSGQQHPRGSASCPPMGLCQGMVWVRVIWHVPRSSCSATYRGLGLLLHTVGKSSNGYLSYRKNALWKFRRPYNWVPLGKMLPLLLRE